MLGFSRKREGGAVLVVGLIMLLLLTIIGLSGMRNSTLQEKMAGAMIDRQGAFQAAEAARIAGEAFVTNAVAIPEPGSQGVVDNDPESGSLAFWQNCEEEQEQSGDCAGFDWAEYGYLNDDELSDHFINWDMRYVIQEVSAGSVKAPAPGDEVDASSPVQTKTVYRITARGVRYISEELSGAGDVILQSILEK